MKKTVKKWILACVDTNVAHLYAHGYSILNKYNIIFKSTFVHKINTTWLTNLVMCFVIYRLALT